MKRPVSILELVKATHTKKGTNELTPRARRTVDRVTEAITQRSQTQDGSNSATGSTELYPQEIDSIYFEVIFNCYYISMFVYFKYKSFTIYNFRSLFQSLL